MLQQLILFLLVTYTSGSHYRGGTVSWDIRQSDYVNNSATVSVRVYQRHSWRRSAAPSFWNTPMCDTSTISNGSALLGEGYLICTSTDCASSVSWVYQSILTQVLCTDFSEDYDYASGEKRTTLQLPIDKRLTYTFASCCWIGLLPINNTPDWGLNLVIDTHRRIDGKFNSAPVSTMSPIVKVPLGQIYTINIPMADIDGDPLRCRWGINESESGGIYYPKGVLQPNPCQLTYNATSIGYEGVALVIEDFDSNNQVLSSIPLQFLIEVVIPPTTTTTTFSPGDFTATADPVTNPPVCLQPPIYKGDWRAGACIGVASNNLTQIRIVVEIPCANTITTIQDILTISPGGMTKGPITPDPNNNNIYIMYLQWTPRSDQYGVHQLCVTPYDSNSQSGQTVCFTFLVDVRAPQFVLNSTSPTGVVPQNQSTWTIATDVDIVYPRDANVSAVFFKRDTSNISSDVEVIRVSMSSADYQSRQITFNTYGIIWEQGQEYYILLDGGVATINQSCGIQSAPIIDTEFWTFSIAAAPTTTVETSATTTTPGDNSSTAIILEDTSTTTTTPGEISSTTTALEDTSTTTTTPGEISSTTTALEDTSTTTTTPGEISSTTAALEDASTTTTTPGEISSTTTTLEDTSTTTTTPGETSSTTATLAVASTITTTTATLRETTTTTTDSTTYSTNTIEKITITPPILNPVCPDWLLFGTIKNITTSDNQRNYTFCFYVNTTLADVTIAANTWTPCTTWKISGAADPLMELYDIENDPRLLAQNDDGNSIPELNCYAAVLSYRLIRGNYRVVIRHSKCNYGKFELRFSAETNNAFK